ncbi:unnamed protein product [marine sediment metagenome]|uniref:Uncharacterized protein n=1 Tax=marine sediment metagenome TaxID=412755 RepID=X0TRJ9_9ZZZZ
MFENMEKKMTLTQKLDAWKAGDRWAAQDGDANFWTAKSAHALLKVSGLTMYDFGRADGSASVQPLDMAILGEVWGDYPPTPESRVNNENTGLTPEQLVLLGRLTARALKEK